MGGIAGAHDRHVDSRVGEFTEFMVVTVIAVSVFFVDCVSECAPTATSVTPAGDDRGSQVSLSCVDAERVMAQLIARGVVGDHRPPDLLRFGFTPLYTRFADALRAAEILGEILA